MHRRRPGGCQDPELSDSLILHVCGLLQITRVCVVFLLIIFITIILTTARRPAVIRPVCISSGLRRTRNTGEDVWLPRQKEHSPHHSECSDVFTFRVSVSGSSLAGVGLRGVGAECHRGGMVPAPLRSSTIQGNGARVDLLKEIPK